MKKITLMLLALTLGPKAYNQCNQATVINLTPSWQNFGLGWKKFTPSEDGTLKICPLGMVYTIYDDCSGSNGINELMPDPTGEFCGSNLCGDQFVERLEVFAGDPVYIRITAPFGDPCGDWVGLRFIGKGDDCLDPAPLECNEISVFNVNNFTNEFNFHDVSACGGSTINNIYGQDRVFELVVGTPTDITIYLNSNKPNRDFLGVFQACSDCFSNCFLDGCVGYSQTTAGVESVVIPNAFGSYLIVADWTPTNQADLNGGIEFELQAWCGDPCEDAEILQCGVTKSSTTIGQFNQFNAGDYTACYSGSLGYNGPDRVFKIVKPSNQGNLMINLFSPGSSDLNVFVFDACGGPCLARGATLANTNLEYITDVDPPLPAGTYYIVVDGATNTAGYNFNLTVTCGDLDCNNAIEIGCGETIVGLSNQNGQNNTSIYNCTDNGVLPGYTGKEMVYYFDLNKTATVTIDLTNLTPGQDFDLLLPGICSESMCARSSINAPGQAEQIIASNLSPGKYYIVVEGWEGSQGNFDLSVNWECCADEVDNNCEALQYQYVSAGANGSVEYEFTLNFPAPAPAIVSNWVTVDGVTVIPASPTPLQNFSYTFPGPGTYVVCYNATKPDGCLYQCCRTIEVLDVSGGFNCLHGDDRINLPTKVRWIDGDVYVSGSNADPASPQVTFATFSRYDALGNLVWAVELDSPSVFIDFVPTEDNAFLLIGRTPVGATPVDNRSILAKIDLNGNQIFCNYIPNQGREFMTAIVRHPFPSNPAFPYYIGGFQNKNMTVNTVDDAFLFNLNNAGMINWKKLYNTLTDNEFGRFLFPLNNGHLLLVGNNASIQGYILEVDGNGADIKAAGDLNDFRTILAGISLPNSDLILGGEMYGTGAVRGGVAKFDANYNPIWGVRLLGQTQVIAVDRDDQNHIFALGMSNISGIMTPVVTRITDAGSFAIVDWVRHLNDGSIANTPVPGTFDVLGTGNIVYADGRKSTLSQYGFQEEDMLLLLANPDLSSCFTTEGVIDSQQVAPIFTAGANPDQNAAIPAMPDGPNAQPWNQMHDCACENCQAQFTYNTVSSGCFQYQFNNTSTGYKLTYQWDFGDGNTSTAQNPTHTYAGPGSYDVCLTVSNGECSNTLCQTIQITAPPFNIICPSNLNLGTDPGVCFSDLDPPAPSVLFHPCLQITESCTRSDGQPLNAPFQPGTSTLTCVATDQFGNSKSCSFAVTVADMEKPTIICPPDMMQTVAQGQTGATVSYPAPTVTDNCGATFTYNPASGSFFPLGMTTVVATAVDAAGNSATCSFIVEVKTDEDGCPAVCQATALNISTGADPLTGMYLNAGNADPLWQLISAPPNSGLTNLPQPAQLIGPFGTSWDAPVSTWISAFPFNNYTEDNCPVDPQSCACPPFVYERCFCLCQAGAVNFNFGFWSDNAGSVELWDGTTNTLITTFVSNCSNPNAVGNFNALPNGPTFSAPPFSINTTLQLAAGRYCLRINHWNISGGAMGVNLNGTVSGLSLESDACCSDNTGGLLVTKYNDLDCDGNRDINPVSWTAIDPGLPGWDFTVVHVATGQTYTGMTNSQGQVSFSNLPPGAYTVTETPRPGWAPTNPAGGSTTVTVGALGTVSVAFGNCSVCEPAAQDSVCDAPVDVLFILDNSGSIASNEFTAMKNLVANSVNQIDAAYSDAQYAVVHYGGPCGEQIYVEHDFGSAASVATISRRFPPGIMDDLNIALGNTLDALNNTANPDILPASTSFLHQRTGSDLLIVIFTDAWALASNFPGCTNTALLPYTNSIALKQSRNARITVVHLDPVVTGADPFAAAIASPGGTYIGPVDNNGFDSNLPGPRQYIPYNFTATTIPILPSLPPCDSLQEDCCDSLQIMATHNTAGNQCCTSVDLKNRVGAPVVKLEAEIISSPGWAFQSGSLSYAAGFNWALPPTNQKISLGHSSGQIPLGTSVSALEYCLASTTATPAATQTVVFRWYEMLPGDTLSRVICTDTVTTNCPKTPGENCIVLASSNIECNPGNPYEYFLNFTVQNLSGAPVSQVVLQNLPPGFGFSFCNASTPVPSIALPLSPNPLPHNATSANLCVKIIAPFPVLSAMQACFRLGLVADSLCCHATDSVCITLKPCCDPCAGTMATAQALASPADGCCYKLDLQRECQYQMFSKVETEILTPGVIFGYHALGGPDASDWFVFPGATPTKISFGPKNGVIDKDLVDDLIQFCLDGIASPGQIPQKVVVRWYTSLPPGERLLCTDTLAFNCNQDINCVEVQSTIVCQPDSSRYLLTMTITNNSSIPFSATDFMANVVSPSDLYLFPTGGIFPLSPPLPKGSSTTISTYLASSSGAFPSPFGSLVLSYRLGFYNGSTFDTCCFENVLDTIPLPPCSGGCNCDSPSIPGDIGFSVQRDGCTLWISSDTLDECHQVTYHWGDGNQNGPFSGSVTTMHTYAASGEYTVCATLAAIDSTGAVCLTQDTCWTVCVTCDTCDQMLLTTRWERTYQGGGWDIFSDVTVAPNGDVYVIGSMSDQLTIENTTLQSADAKGDVVVAKFGPDGKVSGNHVYRFGGNGGIGDRGETIKIAANGDIVIGGRVTGQNIDFAFHGMGANPSVSPGALNVTREHNFVARYNSNFELLWYHIFEGDKVMDIAFYQGNDMIAVGSTYLLGAPALRQNFIARYTPSGLNNWAQTSIKTFGGDRYNDNTWTVETDPAGGIYACGQFSRQEQLGASPPLGDPTYVTSGYVANLDVDGMGNLSWKWAFDILKIPNTNQGGGVTFAIDVEYPYLFVIGNGGEYLDPTPNNAQTFTDPTGGIYVAKYKVDTDPTQSANSLEWGFSIPKVGNDFNDIKLDGMGNLLITGQLRGVNIDLDPNTTPNAKALLSSSGSEQDFFIAKYTDLYNGKTLPTFVSALAVGGPAPDASYGLDVFDGNIYIAGALNHIPFPNFVEADPYLGKFRCECPADLTACCDDLSINAQAISTSPTCCYAFDMQNGAGFDLYQLEVELLEKTDWIINTGSVSLSGGFFLVNNSGAKLTVGHNSGKLPAGFNPGFLNLCLGSLTNPAAKPQTLVFRWYEKLPDGSERVVCADTVKLDCKSPVDSGPCATLSELSVACDPDNPLEYILTFRVTNQSSVPLDAYEIFLQNISPGFGFHACGGSGFQDPVYFQPSPSPLPGGQTSAPLCVKITSLAPVLTPTSVCFQAGLSGQDNFCISATDFCVDLEPCCSPCGDIAVTSHEITFDSAGCCYGLDLENDCKYLFFNKIELAVQTPGIVFGAQTLGDPVNWQVCNSTPTTVCVNHQSGYVPAGLFSDVIQFCLNDVDPGESPQIVLVNYYTQAADGSDSLACTDTLSFSCAGCNCDSLEFPAGFGFSLQRDGCSVLVTPDAAGACQEAFYQWGDGTQSGPLSGTPAATHAYTASGDYTICATVNLLDDLMNICDSRDTCWTVCITCDTCGQKIIEPIWQREFADGKWDIFADVTVGPDGEVYAIGTYTETLDIDGTVLNAQDPKGNVVMAKFHPDGTLSGGHAYGFGDAAASFIGSRGETIKIAPNGDVVIGGRIGNGDVDFAVNGLASGLPANYGKVFVTQEHNFIARYNANFKLLWYDIFKGDKVMDIAFYQGNDMIAAGSVFEQNNPNLRQNFIARYVPDLTPNTWKQDWIRIFGGDRYNDNTWTVETDPAGGIYACGQFSREITVDGITIGHPDYITSGYIANLDAAGKFQWVFDIPKIPITNQGGGVAFAIALDYPYLFAVGNGSDRLDPTPANSQTFVDPTGGIYIAKYRVDSDPTKDPKNLEWGFSIPKVGNDFNDIKLDGMGNLLVTGQLKGNTIDFDPNAAPNPDAVLHSVQNEQDFFIAKYTDLYNGFNLPKYVDVIGVGGPEPDVSYGMDVFNGSIYIAGALKHVPFPSFAEANPFLGKFHCTCPGPAAPEACCDALSVSEQASGSGNDCCHDFSLQNNGGFDIARIEVELLGTDWSVGAASVAPGSGFVLNGSGNLRNIGHSSGTIPGGMVAGFLNLCLDAQTSPVTTPQTLVFRWYERLPDQSVQLVCADTITLNCSDSTGCCLDFNGVTAIDPFNISNGKVDSGFDFVDFDNDGDYDLSSWEFVAPGVQLAYRENTGTNVNPDFASANTLLAFPRRGPVYDYDYSGSGKDFFQWTTMPNSTDNLYYYRHNSTPNVADYTETNLGSLGFVNSNITAHFAIGDLSNDGIPDFIAVNSKIVHYLEGGCAYPNNPCFGTAKLFFTIPLNGTEFPVPEIFDADCDGDLDLFIAIAGEVLLFENKGTVVAPGAFPDLEMMFQSNPYGITGLGGNTEFPVARFVDTDADGKAELYIQDDSEVKYYDNCQASCCDIPDWAFEAKIKSVFQGITASGNTVMVRPTQFDDCDWVTYHWGDGSPATSETGNTEVTHTYPSAAGNYILCIEAVRHEAGSPAACKQDSVCQDISVATIQPLNNSPRIYPNPTSGKIYLDFGYPLSHDHYLRLLDPMGGLVDTRTLPGGQNRFQIHFEYLPTGMYLLEVKDRNGRADYLKLMVDWD